MFILEYEKRAAWSDLGRIILPFSVLFFYVTGLFSYMLCDVKPVVFFLKEILLCHFH